MSLVSASAGADNDESETKQTSFSVQTQDISRLCLSVAALVCISRCKSETASPLNCLGRVALWVEKLPSFDKKEVFVESADYLW